VASGTHWALGIQARAEALSMKDQAAEDRYREAIERLGRCRVATHLARAHLVYGEWLRREGRRRDARAQLHAAHDLLAAMGAQVAAQLFLSPRTVDAYLRSIFTKLGITSRRQLR
jgi:hypothetical protein